MGQFPGGYDDLGMISEGPKGIVTKTRNLAEQNPTKRGNHTRLEEPQVLLDSATCGLYV